MVLNLAKSKICYIYLFPPHTIFMTNKLFSRNVSASTKSIPSTPNLFPKSFFHRRNHSPLTSRSHHSYDVSHSTQRTIIQKIVQQSSYFRRYGWQDLNRFVLTSSGSLTEFTHPFCQPCRQLDCWLRHKDTKTRHRKIMTNLQKSTKQSNKLGSDL